MPNWCDNALIFDSKKDYENIKKHACGQSELEEDEKTNETNTEFDFNTFLSQKLETGNTEGWYEWNVANWGCKWNASNTSWNDDIKTIYFSTPWNGISDQLLTRISNVCKEKITYHYAEPSMDFGGTIYLEQGEITGEDGKESAYKYFNYDQDDSEEN